MDFEVIVFDTAPTGHTLRFLNFPSILEKGLNKLLTLKEKFNGLLQSMGNIFGSKEDLDKTMDSIFGRMERMRETSNTVNKHMTDTSKTTFIAVCIPEFLSMYETERLIQELAKFNIDIHNIVINQILFPDDDCRMCKARSKMQKKYLDQIVELYDDFHIVIMPLQEEEVRGPTKLKHFS
jgi:arsenite-transporting ATPase